MKLPVLVFVVIFAFMANQTTTTSSRIDFLQDVDYDYDTAIDMRIIGGDEAIPHRFPYQVAVIIKSKSGKKFCGGSLISDLYILTAAHCLDDATEVHVILGAHNIFEKENTKKFYKPNDYVIHEKWSRVSLIGDIALIKLPKKTEFNHYIKPIDLPRYSDVGRTMVRKRVTVTGWGRTSDQVDDISPVLRYIEPFIISQSMCKMAFLGLPTKHHICISGIERTAICGGDSGGPMVTMEKFKTPILRGIASFGFGAGCRFIWPSVFTRVSSYLEWIHNKTGIRIRD